MTNLCKWIQILVILLITAILAHIGIDYGYEQVESNREEFTEVSEPIISDEKLLEVLKTHDINMLPNQGKLDKST